MSSVDLKELKLAQHYRLFEQAMGADTPFVVCDEHGVPHWPPDVARTPALERALAWINNSDEGWRGDGSALTRHPLCDGSLVVYRALGGKLTGTIGYAVVLASRGAEAPHPTLLNRIDQVLADIGTCIEAEYLLTEELAQMATELATRYEELNLVYTIEDQIKEYDPNQGVAVLRQLVEDCAEYLDIDGVALFLPDEEIQEIHVCADDPERGPDIDALWLRVRDPLLECVYSERSPLVINERTDPARRRIRIEYPLKLIAVPVPGLRSDVSGVLTAVVGDDKPDFTNSDRKLLEVLAQQVAMVVQSRYDTLTGLLNRRGFDARLQEITAAAQRSGGDYALLLINLDQFKIVNDTCGQTAGDELLKQVSGLIAGGLRGTDTSGRIGGDEFAVLLDGCPSDRAAKVAGKLSEKLAAHRFCWQSKRFEVTCSIGVVALTGGAIEESDILGIAHSACLIAKQEGRGRVHLYHPEDESFVEHRGQLEWVPRLRDALENDRFVLYAQPIVAIGGSAKTSHFEILLRLRDEQGDILSPFAFIPAAERFRLMPDIDRWVVTHTLDTLAAWQADTGGASFRCAVNLSGQSLSDEGFLEFIISEQRRAGIPPERICFEITETAAISSFSTARHFIARLEERGFSFSLDDFGSGLSSFSYLSNLPVDYLKIDGALVKEIIDNPVNAVMVEAINKIGHAMGIETIAEFVENDAIKAKLEDLGVDYAQGYGVGRPAPLTEVLAGADPRPAGVLAAAG